MAGYTLKVKVNDRDGGPPHKKNSRPSKNIQDSHSQQTKQNRKTNTCSSRTPKLKQTVNPRNQK
jgi:hypothetical protein